MIIHLESMNNIYNVGLYIRLSREDDDKTYESESITNQKSLLLQYAKENNLRVYDIYIDDGFTGTNFDRPEFKAKSIFSLLLYALVVIEHLISNSFS